MQLSCNLLSFWGLGWGLGGTLEYGWPGSNRRPSAPKADALPTAHARNAADRSRRSFNRCRNLFKSGKEPASSGKHSISVNRRPASSSSPPAIQFLLRLALRFWLGQPLRAGPCRFRCPRLAQTPRRLLLHETVDLFHVTDPASFSARNPSKAWRSIICAGFGTNAAVSTIWPTGRRRGVLGSWINPRPGDVGDGRGRPLHRVLEAGMVEEPHLGPHLPILSGGQCVSRAAFLICATSSRVMRSTFSACESTRSGQGPARSCRDRSSAIQTAAGGGAGSWREISGRLQSTQAQDQHVPRTTRRWPMFFEVRKHPPDLVGAQLCHSTRHNARVACGQVA